MPVDRGGGDGTEKPPEDLERSRNAITPWTVRREGASAFGTSRVVSGQTGHREKRLQGTEIFLTKEEEPDEIKQPGQAKLVN